MKKACRPLPPLLPAQQARSQKTLEAIYRGANELMQEKSFDRITVLDISRASAVAVGSIYQRFGSKDGLLWALYDHYVEEATTALSAFLENAPAETPQGEIAALISLICDLFSTHRGVVRSLLLKHRATPDETPEYFLSRFQEAYAAIDKVLLKFGAPESNILACRSLIMAACREHSLFNSFDGVEGTNSNSPFVTLLTRSALAVLQPCGAKPDEW